MSLNCHFKMKKKSTNEGKIEEKVGTQIQMKFGKKKELKSFIKKKSEQDEI